jgi:streptogrisin C
MKRSIRGLTGAAIIAISMVTGIAATAAPAVPGGQRPGAGPAGELQADVLAAMQRDLGLTADQAKQRIAQQAKATELERTLPARLGTAFGGSWFDAASGKLVVAVTDAQLVAEVTKAGAQARVVKHSKASLDKIKAELDTLAGKPAGTARAASGERHPDIAGLTGWYVDLTANTVVVTALREQQPAALDRLAQYGDAVRVQYTDAAPRTTDPFLDGGDQILYPNSYCSAGFNLRNPSTGQGYLLIAGHCGTGTVLGHHGTTIGPVLEAWFPTFDDAIIRNDNPGTWIQGPWVDTNPSEGTSIVVIDTYSDSPVGTSVCKSGVTTKLTCGTITAKDETVNYAEGTVYGMTRHSACVEPGDSGGSNFTGSSAEGVTSGAQLYWDGSQYRCGEVFGYPNVSWYFPIVDSLPYYQAVYGVGLW